MKINIATRVHNENYFFPFFIEYYEKLEVDNFFLFSDNENNQIFKKLLNKLQRQKNIHINNMYSINSINYYDQTNQCNNIFNYALEEYENNSEECWWLFIDSDEFIRSPISNSLKKSLQNMNEEYIRTVFFEWYLTPSKFLNMMNPKDFLGLIHKGKLKGKILDLWGDLFYKDNIIKLDENTYSFFKKIKTISGFHRLILDKKVLISNGSFLLVDHLRGIPKLKFQERMIHRMKKIKDENDWSYIHFKYILKILNNYSSYYHKHLKDANELEKDILDIKSIDYDKSYYNAIIMPENIKSKYGSKPNNQKTK